MRQRTKTKHCQLSLLTQQKAPEIALNKTQKARLRKLIAELLLQAAGVARREEESGNE